MVKNMHDDSKQRPYRLTSHKFPESDSKIPMRFVRRKSNYKDEMHYEVCFKKLGKGGFSDVYSSALLCKVNQNGDVYSIQPSKKAVKFLHSIDSVDEARHELDIISKLFSNNKNGIKKGRGHLTIIDRNRYCAALVLPKIEGENLADFFNKNNSFLIPQQQFT